MFEATFTMTHEEMVQAFRYLQEYFRSPALRGATAGGGPEDMFIKPGTPISGCRRENRPTVPGFAGTYFTAGGKHYKVLDHPDTTHEWHFNEVFEVYWFSDSGVSDKSHEFVFIKLENDLEYDGFIVSEQYIF